MKGTEANTPGNHDNLKIAYFISNSHSPTHSFSRLILSAFRILVNVVVRTSSIMIALAVGIPTLVGSLCSLIAASFIFACYFIFPTKPHFRHILILNLATAGT